MANLYGFQIGTTLEGMTNLENLATPVVPPKSHFTQYADQVPLGDNTVRGVGAPTAHWHWDFLTQAQRDQLRIFCAGASAVVYITTVINDSDATENPTRYGSFQAVMIWPSLAEEKDATRRISFDIEFRQLIPETP